MKKRLQKPPHNTHPLAEENPQKANTLDASKTFLDTIPPRQSCCEKDHYLRALCVVVPDATFLPQCEERAQTLAQDSGVTRRPRSALGNRSNPACCTMGTRTLHGPRVFSRACLRS